MGPPDFRFEQACWARGARAVCGVDEAGRGPWAGPVVAAAVILDPGNVPEGINDSKKLDAARREALFEQLRASAIISLGIADVARIDRDNILAATMWAMGEAVRGLTTAPCAALLDGNRAPQLPCPAEAIVSGDALSLSIAAASIIAKVTRDRIMADIAIEFPDYGFARHKGYGTQAHHEALRKHGPCPEHRRSFKPVALTIYSEFDSRRLPGDS